MFKTGQWLNKFKIGFGPKIVTFRTFTWVQVKLNVLHTRKNLTGSVASRSKESSVSWGPLFNKLGVLKLPPKLGLSFSPSSYYSIALVLTQL